MPMLYLVLLIFTHLVSLILVIKRKKIHKFDLNIDRIFSIVSEYMLTKSILRSRLLAEDKVDRDMLFLDRPILVNEGIKVSTIPFEELERRHLEDRLKNVILEIDELLNRLDMYGVLVSGAIIFPILLTSLAVFFVGPIILASTPLTQLILYRCVSRWMRS